MERLNEAIFRAYDIRGVVGEDFDADLGVRVGRAVVVRTGARRVVVGRDARVSSQALADAVIAGIIAQGATAVDIGRCTTPMFNFAVASNDAHEAGVMVSASHNPAKYNGFKMDYGDALPIGEGSGMDDIRRFVVEGAFPDARPGTVVPGEILEDYLAAVTAIVDPEALTPFHMVVDCGNGMAGLTMPHLAPLLPGTVEPLYWELDGTFPNHEPDPIKPANLQDLADAVRSSGADIGFAYDGDADRLGVVDERGELVRGDLLTALLARAILDRHPGAIILSDVRGSRVVAEEVLRAGGRPESCRVGHALIKQHMRRVGAAFGGELSNHFYFQDFYDVESTELAMLLLLSILGEAGVPLSALVAPLRRYAYSGERSFTVPDKTAVLQEIEERYANGARAISKLDGVSVDMGSWWFNVRPSNTEPLLRLVVETPTTEETDLRVVELQRIIEGR